MIYLERLRDDPFLLDGFESNVAEWARLIGNIGRIETQFPLVNSDGFPDELKFYHQIAERWPQFAFQSCGRNGRFITEVEIFNSKLKGESVEYRKFQTEECSCCFLAIRFDQGMEKWIVADVVDDELRRELPFKIDEYLVSQGMLNLSRFAPKGRRSEIETDEFKWLQDESMMIWEIDEYTDCWFNSRGILGYSTIGSGGEVFERWISGCSQKVDDEVIKKTRG